jgi:hypothetical protein
MRGCPVRYRGGPDRPCPQHADDVTTMADRLAAYGAVLEQAPGEHDGDHGQPGGPA